MQQDNTAINVTISNPTPAQLTLIHQALTGQQEKVDKAFGAITKDAAEETTKTRKRKTSAPATTVSDDEDEEFATETLDEDEVMETAGDDPAEFEEEEDEGLQWADVKKKINLYGDKNPEGMKSILLGMNIKSTKELQQHPKKWEAVYRKVSAKLTAAKKK